MVSHRGYAPRMSRSRREVMSIPLMGQNGRGSQTTLTALPYSRRLVSYAFRFWNRTKVLQRADHAHIQNLSNAAVPGTALDMRAAVFALELGL